MKSISSTLRAGLPLAALGAALWLTAAEPQGTGLHSFNFDSADSDDKD